jgi:hypothetical protein
MTSYEPAEAAVGTTNDILNELSYVMEIFLKEPKLTYVIPFG